MAQQPVHRLSYRELQDELRTTSSLNATRHDLRRECARRAERWGTVANYSGLVVLGFVLVLSAVSLVQR